jgi:hypothetical protein
LLKIKNMKKTFSFILSICLSFVGIAQSSSASDNPCGAFSWPVFAADILSSECQPIQTSNYYVQYTNATLTGGVPNPSCVSSNPQNIRDVWFRCQVPASGRLNIKITDGAPDLVLAVYTTVGGCSGTFTEVGCNNDFTGTNPRLQLAGLTPATEVLLRIFNHPSTVVTTGGFYLCISDYFNNLPTIDNSTKVGIGASTPFAKLDVAGTGIFRDKAFFAKDIEARGSIKVKGKLNVDSLFIRNGFPGEFLTADFNGLSTWQALPAGVNAWSVNGTNISNSNAGNVGIGVINPNYKLHIGEATNGVRIEGQLTSGSGGAALSIGHKGNIVIDRPFQTGGRFIIKENGNIGIGTATPVVKLDIAGTDNWDLTNTEGDFRIGDDDYRIKMGVALSGGGAGAGRIRAVGGINTLYLGAGTTDVLTLFSNGNATLVGTLTQASDARLKKNIKILSPTLNNLSQLNGYTYDWINEQKDKEQQIGLLAQEVQKIYPQLVKQNSAGELSVNYSGLVPVLLEGLKEQQKQLSAQQKQIDEQRKLIDKILKK